MIFSVIIPTCNRNDLLDLCLEKLSHSFQKMLPEVYEVIVSDDSKDNNARNLIENKYSWARWISGPKKGPAANRNNGAKLAKGDWLVFIDDDCLPLNNLLDAYQKAIAKHPYAGAFEGAIWPDNENLLKKEMAECPVNKTGGNFWTANVCISQAAFKRVNGFDEEITLAAHEDQLLYIKLKEIVDVIFASEAKVIHPVRFGSFKKKILNNNKSLSNWLVYMNKRKINLSTAVKDGAIFHAKDLIQNLTSLRFRKSFLNIYTIIFGLPILIITNATKKKKI